MRYTHWTEAEMATLKLLMRRVPQFQSYTAMAEALNAIHGNGRTNNALQKRVKGLRLPRPTGGRPGDERRQRRHKPWVHLDWAPYAGCL